MESSYSTSDEQLNNGSSSGKQDSKKQQFTKKQRLDLYAFCVLELELHSHQVSVRRQQQAIERAMAVPQRRDRQIVIVSTANSANQRHNHQNSTIPAITNGRANGLDPTPSNTTDNNNNPSSDSASQFPPSASLNQTLPQTSNQPQPTTNSSPSSDQPPPTNEHQSEIVPNQNGVSEDVAQQTTNNSSSGECNSLVEYEGKTLEQLQEEFATKTRCYSDHQKTQVLTSQMLRDVQKRFAKYYPDSIIPSRTTIKHLFDKCVAHGTVENIKTPKTKKVPQCDEIQHLLIHEPQLSLRQMARRLNISVGTVSRRCKALGLVPDSVTIKHQQLSLARRRKHLKQIANKSKQIESIEE